MSSAQYLRLQINSDVYGYVLVDASYLLSSLFCLTYIPAPYVRSGYVDVASTIHADHLLVFIGNIFIAFNKKLENIVLIMGCIVKHSTRMTYFYWSAHDVFAIHISHIVLVLIFAISLCFLHVRMGVCPLWLVWTCMEIFLEWNPCLLLFCCCAFRISYESQFTVCHLCINLYRTHSIHHTYVRTKAHSHCLLWELIDSILRIA